MNKQDRLDAIWCLSKDNCAGCEKDTEYIRCKFQEQYNSFAIKCIKTINELFDELERFKIIYQDNIDGLAAIANIEAFIKRKMEEDYE